MKNLTVESTEDVESYADICSDTMLSEDSAIKMQIKEEENPSLRENKRDD